MVGRDVLDRSDRNSTVKILVNASPVRPCIELLFYNFSQFLLRVVLISSLEPRGNRICFCRSFFMRRILEVRLDWLRTPDTAFQTGREHWSHNASHTFKKLGSLCLLLHLEGTFVEKIVISTDSPLQRFSTVTIRLHLVVLTVVAGRKLERR